MVAIDRQTILAHRLPARMRELCAFVQMAPALNLATDQPIQVVVADQIFTLSNSLFVLHPLADSAVLMSRALLHFMGVGLTTAGHLCNASYKPEDLRMADIGLRSVAVSNSIRGWQLPPDRAEYLIKLCIMTGHKVSGHFTTKTAQLIGATISELGAAFELVNALVNREVYQALGLPPIDFSSDLHGLITRSRYSERLD